jgi:AcrR family transcriptional regulator
VTGPPPPRSQSGGTKSDRTRQSLIAAGIVRFAREGYRGTSVADICRDAGYSTTASYPYFASKEALFVTAVDEDVAQLIGEAVSLVAIEAAPDQWSHTMIHSLITRMDDHPLARRIISGLEPEFTMRLLDIPALAELRKKVVELLRTHQITGLVRRDVDPIRMANGLVIIVISLLMATMQTGEAGFELVAEDVEAVLNAATRPSG